MKGALKIGKPFGISIGIHWTFLFLIAYIVAVDLGRGLNYQQIFMSVLFIIALFACVILHELGHSLTAKSLGGEVKSIILLPIGGMANIKKMPDKPREEFLITIAGLAVNVVIAFVLAIILSATGSLHINQLDFSTITTKNFFMVLMIVNLFIVVFNLIPAFPMDGGRILRSLLSFRMDKIRATRIAQTVGKMFAVAFVIIGLFYNPFLIIIGIFVFIGAQAEYQMIKYNNVLDKYSVGDVVSTDYIVLQPEDTLEKAANTLIHRSANGFIIMSDDEYRGILTKEDIIKGLSSSGNNGKINEVLNGHHYSTTPEMNLNKVFQEMMKNKSPIVPVFSDNKITGILDLENIQELIMIEQASRRTEHNY